MKVLVIEDEKKIASFVRKGLEAEGFVVDVCLDGDTGFVLATSRPYDVLVLDIMLPGGTASAFEGQLGEEDAIAGCVANCSK